MAEQKEQITNRINSKHALSEVLDLLQEGAQIIDFNWRCVYVNDTLAQYEKTSKEILLGQSMMERYPDIRQTDIFNSLQHCMTKRESQQIVAKQVYPDNSEKWLNLKIEPIDDGILILSSDITDSKESEEKINKIKHLYAFISQVNQNIVRVKSSEALFGNACRIAIEFGKFKMAWIGMFDTTCTKITLVDQTGIPGEDVGLFTEILFEPDGPQDYVLRTGKYYICNDIANDLKLESWKPFAARHHLQSCLVLPIKKAEKIIGTFNLYSTELHFSSQEEIALLVEVTGDISFALDLFEKAKKHKEIEDLVIKNEKRFRALIEKSNDMKTLSTPKGRFLYCSPSVWKVLGYSLEEFLCKSDSDLIYPDDLPDFIKQRNKLLETEGGSFYFQHRLVDIDGKLIWCEGTVSNMLHEQGVQALVSNFRDISEKKTTELQQEFDKNNLEALINNTYDLLWSVDKEFNLITSNQPFDDMIKLITGTEIVKGNDILKTAFSEDRLTRFKNSCNRAFAGEIFTEIEYRKNLLSRGLRFPFTLSEKEMK